MSLNTVVVSWDEEDIGQNALSGNITFTLSGVLPDPADGVNIHPGVASPYYFTSGTGQSEALVANDNANLPAGSYYTISINIAGQQPYVFQAVINYANGATQKLSYLLQNAGLPTGNYGQYMPLPSGTPEAGQIPAVVTNGSTTTQWVTPSGGEGSAVTSVFGRTGAVVAESGDYTAAQVGADPSGSAATAQSNAEAYALAKANNLSDLASAATARTNLGLGSAATQASSAFDAAGAASAAQSAAEAASLPITGGTLEGGIAPAAAGLTQASGDVAVNAAAGDAFNLTLTASGWTISNPTGAVGDGQVIRFRLTQGTGGSFTVTWGSAYDFGASSAPTLSTTAGKIDIIAFEWVASISKWAYLGSGLGY